MQKNPKSENCSKSKIVHLKTHTVNKTAKMKAKKIILKRGKKVRVSNESNISINLIYCLQDESYDI